MADPSAQNSVTRLIRGLQDGRDSAVAPLFEVYFDRLVRLARERLRGAPGAAGYDEDVALRAFFSLCQRIRDRERPVQLDSRDDLWRLLATRTVSRAIDLIRRQRPTEGDADEEARELLAREPTPAEATEMADECRRLLDRLDEPELRQIALWKVEGYTNEEIAQRLDCVPRTIERKLGRIRVLWRAELEELDS